MIESLPRKFSFKFVYLFFLMWVMIALAGALRAAAMRLSHFYVIKFNMLSI